MRKEWRDEAQQNSININKVDIRKFVEEEKIPYFLSVYCE